MVDPEELYGKLVSGNSSTVRGQADSVGDAIKKVKESSSRVAEAAERPKWTSDASTAYKLRTAGLTQGLNVNVFALGRMQTALRSGASAYDAMASKAKEVIPPWRNRPAGLNPVIEDLLALGVHLGLVTIAASYSSRLRTIAAFASGETIDENALDEDTRKWLANGMDKTAEWLKENGGGLGPQIPNLGLGGDDRGLIPQGLGIDPDTGWIIQTNYSKNGDPSTLSMIDPTTGREMVDVQLGGTEEIPTPDHAGGVASDGKYTYVTSSGDPSHVFTYLTSDLRKGGTEPVDPIGPPTRIPSGAGAYGTVKDGMPYVGTHSEDIGGGGNKYDGENDDGRMYRSISDGHGGWVPDPSFGGGTGYVHTPPQAQGVVVRDGEYVFSTSLGRDNPGRLITQERQDDQPGNGDRGDPYELPYMSEGIIELDGNIIATYESGADYYGPHADSSVDDDDLWANPYMTKTSLEALGLSPDF
ncbi:hypothetical protein [Knoellia subterranea]|uniref:Uncharacterized protein n=1 Tax=Knoellia subterranea KCTC 19937 TaxID=1385521 RepID=A0A0A0JM85_9MICO|nr:hypothetical protein [Knoellia subterranea]KGN37864.1 hypothetical protein N803_12450 [Knoellia subterranea KCTC 19937]